MKSLVLMTLLLVYASKADDDASGEEIFENQEFDLMCSEVCMDPENRAYCASVDEGLSSDLGSCSGNVLLHEFSNEGGVSMFICESAILDNFSQDSIEMFTEMESAQDELVGSECEEKRIASSCRGVCPSAPVKRTKKKYLDTDEYKEEQHTACIESLEFALEEVEDWIGDYAKTKKITRKRFASSATTAILKKIGSKSAFMKPLLKVLLPLALLLVIDAILEHLQEIIQEEGYVEAKNENIEAVCEVLQTALDDALDNIFGCFEGSSEVHMGNGGSKKLQDVQIGDRILVHTASGKPSFSPVVFLPHKKNYERSQFLRISTKSGNSISATMAHMIQDCNGSLVLASSLKLKDCVKTIDGDDEIVFIQSVIGTGIYTAITLGGDYLVVNGIFASPFASHEAVATAISHHLAQGFYNIHRIWYVAMPSSSIVESYAVHLFTKMVGAFAFLTLDSYDRVRSIVVEALSTL